MREWQKGMRGKVYEKGGGMESRWGKRVRPQPSMSASGVGCMKTK